MKLTRGSTSFRLRIFSASRKFGPDACRAAPGSRSCEIELGGAAALDFTPVPLGFQATLARRAGRPRGPARLARRRGLLDQADQALDGVAAILVLAAVAMRRDN